MYDLVHRLAPLGWAGLSLSVAVPASACPFCASETGQQIYAGIFDASFVPTLLLVLAPFPVLIGSVSLVRRWVSE